MSAKDNICNLVCAKVKERGISIAELARRTGINDDRLRRVLKGKRTMKASEFISLCLELEISISDFHS